MLVILQHFLRHLLCVHPAPARHVPVGVAVLEGLSQGVVPHVGARQPDSQQVSRALYEVLVVVDDPVTEVRHSLLVVGSPAVVTLTAAGVVRSGERG